MAKKPSDVLGFVSHCPNFVQCPVCYGCRAYDSSSLECQKCLNNKKQNICNKKLHRADLVSKLITKTVVRIENEIDFSSANDNEGGD